MAENAAPASSEHVNIKVASGDGGELFFKIKKSTPLKRLFEAYCKKQGLEITQVRFQMDGDRLDGNKTPADYDIEDENTIDAMVEQTGGSF